MPWPEILQVQVHGVYVRVSSSRFSFLGGELTAFQSVIGKYSSCVFRAHSFLQLNLQRKQIFLKIQYIYQNVRDVIAVKT